MKSFYNRSIKDEYNVSGLHRLLSVNITWNLMVWISISQE